MKSGKHTEMVSVLCLHIPIEVTIGLDQYSFNVQKGQIFSGLTNIPNGLHLIHFQHGGVRYGYWFHTNDNFYIQYEDDSEIFELKIEEDVLKYESLLNAFRMRHSLAEYPKIDENDASEQWVNLVRYIEWDQIKKFVNHCTGQFIYIDSSMTTKEENDILQNILERKNNPHVVSPTEEGNKDASQNYLEYTPIKMKSRESIRKGCEMIDFINKTYYFNEVLMNKYYHGNIRLFYSELQFTYMNSVMFGNYGSSLQWHSMIEVICFSQNIYAGCDGKSFITEIDSILSSQLTFLPVEYTEMLLNESLWERCIVNSFQGPYLPKTKEVVLKKFRPIFQATGDKQLASDGTNDDDDDDGDEGMEIYDDQNNDMLPSIDSSDEEDDGPVVVETVAYRNVNR